MVNEARTPLRRIRAAAPLKRGGNLRGACCVARPPPHPRGGPGEAKGEQQHADYNRDGPPPQPCGGPVEAGATGNGATDDTPLRRIRAAAPLKPRDVPLQLCVGVDPSPPPHPCGGPVEAVRTSMRSMTRGALRRIRAAAPLKQHGVAVSHGARVAPPPHPCGGPVEASGAPTYRHPFR